MSGGDLQQQAKAVSHYSSVGDFYTGAGIVNAYTATAVSPRLAPPALADGMIIRMLTPITNTGASTLNAFGTGVVNIKLLGGSTNPVAGDMVATEESVLTYRTAPSAHWELTNARVSGSAIIPDASPTEKGIIELATQSEVDTGTDTVRALTPDTLNGAITSCKAWANVDGTGTISIRDSFNISSITDNGVGDISFNFSTAMADANYSFSGVTSTTIGTDSLAVVILNDAITAMTAGSLRILTMQPHQAAAVDNPITVINVHGN